MFFALTWLGQGLCQWQVLQMENNYNAELTNEYFLAHFWFTTFAVWQSVFLQLFIFVTIITVLLYKDHPAELNTDSLMKHKLDKIDDTVSKIGKIAGVE